MPILATESKTEFENAPQGVHIARCYRIIDLGSHTNSYGKEQRKIMLSWELPNALRDDGNPFIINQRYTLSLSEKAHLRNDIEAWIGGPLTNEHMTGVTPDGTPAFEVGYMLGRACQIQVVHEESNNGKTYANINSIMALPEGLECPPMVNEAVYLALTPEDFEMEVFNKLSDGLKETIQKSPEWPAAYGSHVKGN